MDRIDRICRIDRIDWVKKLDRINRINRMKKEKMSMKRLVMVIGALWMGAAQGGTCYVRPDGNDGNTGTRKESVLLLPCEMVN